MRFHAAKRSEMCSVFMKRLGTDDTQDSCFEDWKRSHMGCSALLCGGFADSQNRVFRFRNVQILEVLSWKIVVLLIFTNSVFKQQNVQIWAVSKC